MKRNNFYSMFTLGAAWLLLVATMLTAACEENAKVDVDLDTGRAAYLKEQQEKLESGVCDPPGFTGQASYDGPEKGHLIGMLLPGDQTGPLNLPIGTYKFPADATTVGGADFPPSFCVNLNQPDLSEVPDIAGQGLVVAVFLDVDNDGLPAGFLEGTAIGEPWWMAGAGQPNVDAVWTVYTKADLEGQVIDLGAISLNPPAQ